MCDFVYLFIVVLAIGVLKSYGQLIVTTEDLENHINPEDLKEFMRIYNSSDLSQDDLSNRFEADYASADDDNGTLALPVPDVVDCFGLGGLTRLLFNMKPDTVEQVNTHFYFSSRKHPKRVQVYPGNQFGLEWVDFDRSRKTILIVHGFMSHSNASWVTDMTRAFLSWSDVNVIAADWSGGGNTWKYWRAVANTRRVGSDITGYAKIKVQRPAGGALAATIRSSPVLFKLADGALHATMSLLLADDASPALHPPFFRFMRQLILETGANPKDFHFVGHSLGAHICSYVSYHLGGVHRITGLDPAQPCFRTSNPVERLDETDADFVDVIHTNGRLLQRIGFGLPDPAGHADFYPNGGMRQPGCFNNSSIWTRLLGPINRIQAAICSHGRSYLLFTESLINDNCTFKGHLWNLTYEGVNASLKAVCDRRGSCSSMGIQAIGLGGTPKAQGPYFVLTTEKEPYCPTDWERQHPRADLLWDLRKGFRIDRSRKLNKTTSSARLEAYADPDEPDIVSTTTPKSWFKRWFG